MESDLRSISAWVSFLLQISVRASHENPTTFLGVKSLFFQHFTNPARKLLTGDDSYLSSLNKFHFPASNPLSGFDARDIKGMNRVKN